ncbi:unnamed protein product, partial [Mesorhabditis belari]|uniref:Uncharacterized protein n=1 Tax=Mesorhabditis belari TaxID=2138241 RepID=A0AAF3E874_9BILA
MKDDISEPEPGWSSPGMRVCSVCEAPSNGYHFNAPSCSACAAFFRRTVTLDRQFACPYTNGCLVNFTMRVICRACRYSKCIKAGMDRKAVQPRRDRNVPRRRAPYAQPPRPRTISQEQSSEPPEQSTFEFDPPQSVFDFPTNFTHWSSPVNTLSLPQMLEDPMKELLRLERLYNERRKLLYCARSSISKLLSTCEIDDIPYSEDELEVLTYASIQKDIRPQILLTYEWIRAWKHTQLMNLSDKKMFLRRCILYHTILDPAYLTFRLGRPDKFVMFNGLFVGIERDSTEGWADEAGIISSSLKQELYRPLMERVVNELVEPMRQIGLTYHEYVVLKGLISFKGSGVHELEPGIKELMKKQVDAILFSLNDHYKQLGYSSHQIAERTGNIVLLMSAVFAVSMECLESHQKIQFFDLWELDDLVLQLLSRRSTRKTTPSSPNTISVSSTSSLTSTASTSKSSCSLSPNSHLGEQLDEETGNDFSPGGPLMNNNPLLSSAMENSPLALSSLPFSSPPSNISIAFSPVSLSTLSTS